MYLVSAYASSYFDLDAIKKETNWTDVSVQKLDEFNHLSLISQSPYYYEKKLIDNNYYYPSTAGQGIDIYIIDYGVILNHEDFEIGDKFYNDRTISCDAIIHEKNKVITVRTTKEEEKLNCVNAAGGNQGHGTMAASLAAGNISGVAKKANIHFLASDNTTQAHKTCAKFIIDNATPGKTVVSISSSGIGYNKEDGELLEKLVNNGFIVIVSAANDDRNCCTKDKYVNFISYPGYGIAITTRAIDPNIYYDGYKKSIYTNYGKCVDVFAPGDVVFGDAEAGYDTYKYTFGTSCSTPIVAGMAALIMAEQPEITYNQTTMREKLIEMSIKDGITDLKYLASPDTPNYFVNNGKRSVYSPNDDGVECGKDHGECHEGCCSKEGRCVKYENNPWEVCLIENGCQEKYGTCYSKNETVSECEKLLKDYEDCIVDPSENSNVCQIFNSERCKLFYKHIYADQTICAYVKKDKSNKNRSSLSFIYNFTKEVYNEYDDICNDNLIYQESKCKRSFGQCNIKEIGDKYAKNNGEIVGMHERLKQNNCYDIYDNEDKLNEKINNTPSCQFAKNAKSMDYLLNNVLRINLYSNFIHDYILHQETIYESCIISEKNQADEVCGDINCPYLFDDEYFKLIIFNNESFLSESDKEIMKKIIKGRNDYKSKCKYYQKVVIANEEFYSCEYTKDIIDTSYNYNWGLEDNHWCVITERKKCWSRELDKENILNNYSCCRYTKNVAYTDEDGDWGYENNQWCGIIN